MVQRLLSGNRIGIWLNNGRIRRLAHLAEYSSLGFFASLYSWRRCGLKKKSDTALTGLETSDVSFVRLSSRFDLFIANRLTSDF